MKPSEEQIRAKILHKMDRKRKWGASHTALTNLHKWCPHHFSKEYSKVADDLIREGFLIQKPTHYGMEVSLNPQKKDEISWLVRKVSKEDA